VKRDQDGSNLKWVDQAKREMEGNRKTLSVNKEPRRVAAERWYMYFMRMTLVVEGGDLDPDLQLQGDTC
jgi:hypothetical protein